MFKSRFVKQSTLHEHTLMLLRLFGCPFAECLCHTGMHNRIYALGIFLSATDICRQNRFLQLPVGVIHLIPHQRTEFAAHVFGSANNALGFVIAIKDGVTRSFQLSAIKTLARPYSSGNCVSHCPLFFSIRYSTSC